MQWIKYQIVCNENKNILITKKVGYSEANLNIARTEAHNGEYEIITDENNYEKEPLPIEFGGTGASTASGARENLEVITKYSNPSKPINTVGGISPSKFPNGFTNLTFADLIEAMFYPYTKPTVGSVTLSPISSGTKEAGVQINVRKVSATVTKKSKDIAKVELYQGSTLRATKTGNHTGTVGFDVDINVTGETNTTFKIRATDVDGGYGEGSATYTFVNPYYFTVLSVGTAITADNVAKGKRVEAQGTKTHSYTTTADQFPVIAYPKSYGELSSIKDANGFGQTWAQTEVEINGVDYYVYSGGAAAATNFAYTFTY